MIFTPQQYKIEDKPNVPFIDTDEIDQILETTKNPSFPDIEKIISRSLSKNRLTLAETATLLNATSPEAIELIKNGAHRLKQMIYGNRIVLFAPLYIGNRCINNCAYCGFRKSNDSAIRHTLSTAEIVQETEALESSGHKRLILVYGEHPIYDADYIADTVRLVYGVKLNNGEIRRVNINAAPFDVEGFVKIKAAGIGTFQVFQETYNPEAYKRYHLAGPKRDYDYRLTAMDRAMEAGIDDVGLGALFGLSDWRFEVMALVRHTNHLEACFGVGPHTISFPRIKAASDVSIDKRFEVSDADFLHLVAVLRLAVPYTGMILTAREPAALRDKLIEFGISQIDGGTKLEIGGYSVIKEDQNLNREQFQLNDDRSLSEIVSNLVSSDRIPSFCTACYRKGRTGEHFMEFSVNGFIKRFCTPNALITFAEYVEDYANETDKVAFFDLIAKELKKIESDDPEFARKVETRLLKIKTGERDQLF